MADKPIRIAIGVVAAGLFAACGIGILVTKRSAPAPIVITDPGSDPPPPLSSLTPGAASDPTTSAPAASTTPAAAPPAQAPQSIAVDVAGAVRHPTVYNLPPDSRIQQAIHAAGGPTADADLDQVNLAEKLTDGEKIYIPHKGSSASSQPEASSAGNSLGLIAVPPAPVYTAPGGSVSGTFPPDSGSKSGHGHSHSSNKLASPADGQIDLNTATEADLERVPGIGPAMAGRILAYRQQNGGFQSVDQLRQVPGIGDKKLARMAPFFVIGGR